MSNKDERPGLIPRITLFPESFKVGSERIFLIPYPSVGGDLAGLAGYWHSPSFQ